MQPYLSQKSDTTTDTQSLSQTETAHKIKCFSIFWSSAFFGSSSPTFPAGFLTHRSSSCQTFSHDSSMQWHPMTTLPVHSDRIAQDSHLIPYYPRSNQGSLEALENSVISKYNKVPK